MDSSAAADIRTARQARGLTQAEVAQALHVSEGAVSQWEQGRTAPNRVRAAKLDDLLRADGSILRALGYVMPAVLSDGIDARLDMIIAMLERRDGAVVDAIREEAESVRQWLVGLFVERVARFDEVLSLVEALPPPPAAVPSAKPPASPAPPPAGRKRSPTRQDGRNEARPRRVPR